MYGYGKGSITSLIDALESMNLVYRENDLEDKRKLGYS